MKKIYAFCCLFLLLFCCSCNSERPSDALSKVPVEDEMDEFPTSPTVFSMEISSINELQNVLNLQNSENICSYFKKNGVVSEDVDNVRSMLHAIQAYRTIVPYINDAVIELRNEKGYSNITIFSREKYGLPCIFYHPKVSSGDNLYIKITFIPNGILQNESTVSDIIKILAPEYPNIDNVGGQCKAVYNQTLNLADYEVTALIYEYHDDNRNSTIFVYGSMLVEVRNDPKIWGEEWFSALSFGDFPKE